MIMLIIQKGLKSLQLRLNEYVMSKNKKETVSNSAFTQARAKLKYTAFIECKYPKGESASVNKSNITTVHVTRVVLVHKQTRN